MSESVSRFCVDCEEYSRGESLMNHNYLVYNCADENVVNLQCLICNSWFTIKLPALSYSEEFRDWLGKFVAKSQNNGFVVATIVDPIEFYPPVGAKSIDEILPRVKRISKADSTFWHKYPWLL